VTLNLQKDNPNNLSFWPVVHPVANTPITSPQFGICRLINATLAKYLRWQLRNSDNPLHML